MRLAAALVVVVFALPAHADKPQSKAVTAAAAWIKAMTEASAAPPAGYDKTHPLEYSVQSPVKACAKFTKDTGKVTTAADLKAFKACLVGTRGKVDKAVRPALDEIAEKRAGLDKVKFLKAAAKGTVLVGGDWVESGVTNLSMTLAVTPDGTVSRVWVDYVENEGE